MCYKYYIEEYEQEDSLGYGTGLKSEKLKNNGPEGSTKLEGFLKLVKEELLC